MTAREYIDPGEEERSPFDVEPPGEAEKQLKRINGTHHADKPQGKQDSDGWTDPQPLTEDHAPKPYPSHKLPAGIREAVAEVVDFVQCPESIAACSALSALSLASQALADVERAASLKGPTSLYVLAVAESGERKSTADSYFKKPLTEWESRQREEQKPKMAATRAALSAWEAKKKAQLSKIGALQEKGKSTTADEQILIELEKAKPVPERWPQLLYAEDTPEALAWYLARPDGWPSGGKISAEAGIVFGSHGMGRDSVMRNLALLNELWDGVGHNVNRRTSESFNTSGTRLTVGLAAQAEVVRRFIEQTEISRGIGFIARFLIAWPETKQGSREFKEPPTWAALSRFNDRISALLGIEHDRDADGRLQPKTLRLSPEAKALWIKFHNDVERELSPGGPFSEMKDVASKAADNVARLAALFHIYRHGPTGDIGAAEMDAAGAIVSWHLYEARRFLGEVAIPEVTSDATRLSEWLARYCQGLAPASAYPQKRAQKTASLNRRTARIHGPVRDGERFDKAVNELEEAIHLKTSKEGRGKLLTVNPKLWDWRGNGAR